MIRIEHLSKRFGHALAVDDVNMDVAPGESVALWGVNGAGKSTIIRCVLGLLAYQGSIRVAGLNAARQGKAVRRLIGYVPQELGFNDELRVHEALGLFGRLKGVDVANVDELLSRVGLAGQGAKRMRELSGGMKQRLALAIALLGDPPVLVLDEVTASLDACGRDEFVALLAGLGGQGRAMLFASHRTEEVQALAGRVVVLDRGRIVREIRPADLAGEQQAKSVLRLHLKPPASAQAVEALRRGGYEAHPNGVGILVSVPRTHKAAPLRLLAEANIHVEDFDVVDGRSGEARP